MNKKKFNVGIVGLGHLGNYHIQQYLNIPDANIIGLYDIDNNIKSKISKKYNLFAYNNLKKLLLDSDAISITVPTAYHYEIANMALDYNCHLFIEKPITSSINDAKKIISKSKKNNLIIQVGHIEHFNPAFLSINKTNIKPQFIESHRLAPFNIRGTDVPVVLDLMIHDLGLILSLVKSKIKLIKANGVKLFSESIDLANARIEFINGCVANLTASRISQKTMRKLRIFQKNHYTVIDFKNSTKSSVFLNDNSKIIKNTIPKVYKGNPLRSELENFINSVKNNVSPTIDGSFALEALSCAITIQNIINDENH